MTPKQVLPMINSDRQGSHFQIVPEWLPSRTESIPTMRKPILEDLEDKKPAKSKEKQMKVDSESTEQASAQAAA